MQLSCEQLRGVGERTLNLLHKLQLHTTTDLLLHFPFRYEDRSRLFPIATLRPGQYVQIQGTTNGLNVTKGRRTTYHCMLKDASGSISLRFFHLSAKQVAFLRSPKLMRCYGEVKFDSRNGLTLMHPEFQVVVEDTPLSPYLTPVYPTVAGLTQRVLRDLIQQAIEYVKNDASAFIDFPSDIMASDVFPSLLDAILHLHQPPPDADVEALIETQHPTAKRLILDELVAQQLNVCLWKTNKLQQKAPVLAEQGKLSEKLCQQLPFELTSAQKRVLQEIQTDLKKTIPMLRLVQGDVGSGKTIVAALAALQAIENGCQVAIMAPTEILAEQHWRNFQQWLSPLGISLAYLVGSLKASEKKQVIAQLDSGEASVVVGTHALFQEHVTFNHLGLVIVDEQHRFGVHQRLALLNKGKDNEQPHQLIMTATPIPRSLAMVAYADLEQSIIDELPKGRQPITTVAIENNRRDAVIERIREQCHEGRQVYWVCPLIETSELLQCQAAEQTMEDLKAVLPELKIGMVHGRLSPEDKKLGMAAFKMREMDVLVATTVIEVGVDVPNASLMVIENPERLGLAQLHQLRGRIGRGDIASYCVLLYQSPLGEQARERLNILRESQDGFVIAQKDLEIRGPGEFLGTRQAGLMQFKIADLMRDKALVDQASQIAQHIIAKHPQIVPTIVTRWMGKKAADLGGV